MPSFKITITHLIATSDVWLSAFAPANPSERRRHHGAMGGNARHLRKVATSMLAQIEHKHPGSTGSIMSA